MNIAWVNVKADHTCQVINKDRSTDSDGNSVYRVYTKNCGVLEVQDEWLVGQFNSADTFNSIQPGGTYDVSTLGWRNGFLSQFPNIIRAKQVGRE